MGGNVVEQPGQAPPRLASLWVTLTPGSASQAAPKKALALPARFCKSLSVALAGNRRSLKRRHEAQAFTKRTTNAHEIE